MQHALHASHGAVALGTRHGQAAGDARRSMALVGSTTGSRGGVVAGEAPGDPVAAARAWLHDPARRTALDPRVLRYAEQSIEHAAAHLRELDLLAGELAREANDVGSVDPLRLDRVDAMAALLRTWSERMRSMLDPALHEQADDVEPRLRAAVGAAERTGLAGLVAAL